MGIESPVHLLFLAAVALIVLGPRRLPALAKALGQGIREFRESLTEGSGGQHPAEQPPVVQPAVVVQAASAPPPVVAQTPPAAETPANEAQRGEAAPHGQIGHSAGGERGGQ